MKHLKIVLQVNSVSSGITGLILLVFNRFVSEMFGIPLMNDAFIGVGFFLIAFAIFVFSESHKIQIRLDRVRIITGLDISWVIASAIILFTYWNNISTIGSILVIIVALWVAAMACLQLKYGTKLQKQSI